MIRAAHERPEAMEEGTFIMSGLEKNRIIESIKMIVSQFESGNIPKTVDYNLDNVSLKVSRIILVILTTLTELFGKKTIQPE